MIFKVIAGNGMAWIGDAVYLDAESYYDAKEYCRRWPGAVVRQSWVGDTVPAVDVVVVGRTAPTSYERDQDIAEHHYARGYRDGLEAREE